MIAQLDATHIKPLTKEDMMGFFKQYIDPRSETRAKLAVYLIAQAKSDVSTQQISKLVKTLDLDSTRSAQAATDLQAKLSAADHDEKKEIDGLKNYLLHDLMVAEDKIDAAVEAWKKLHSEVAQTNGVEGTDAQSPPSWNGTQPLEIDDVRSFKAGLAVTAGARPAKDLSEYEELDSKL
jgi:insulysin